MEKVTLEFLFGVKTPWRSDRYLLGQEVKGEYEYGEEKWRKPKQSNPENEVEFLAKEKHIKIFTSDEILNTSLQGV